MQTRRQQYNRGLIAQTGYLPEGTQLIQDVFPMKVVKRENVMTEGYNGRERPVMRITGLIQQADFQNANGREYPYPVLSNAVRNIQEDVGRRAVMGELDHPSDAKIHLDRVSHLMTKVWMDGKKVYGEAEILESQPCGAMLKGLFESNVQVGISSRGVGDMEVMEHNGQERYIVSDGFAIVTWDTVAEPSVSGAVMKLMEGKLRPIRCALNTEARKGLISKETIESVLVNEIKRLFR